MTISNVLSNAEIFSEILFEKMIQINPGVEEMELYEFRYGLDNLSPKEGGWAGIEVQDTGSLEKKISSIDFFNSIQIKPRQEGRIVLDESIVRLTRMLFAGLLTGQYSEEWVRAHFSFDIRGFYFLVRTIYLTAPVLAHFGGQPWKCFEPKQKRFERSFEIGYKEFKAANAEVDQAFIETIQKLIATRGTPILLAIAGPTAAGKTEIVSRLRATLEQAGQKSTSIEMDNFFTDRDGREEKGIGSLGKQAIHFELFQQSLAAIRQGQKITIPRYDFIFGTSSHSLDGKLKPGRTPVEVEPADITFIEGNFPFLLPEIAPLIGIKVVYLTDDAVRLKRKWRRDIDFRMKYDPSYLRNRFFREQFIMAEKCYRPQLQVCDVLVDTTGAAIWAAPQVREER